VRGGAVSAVGGGAVERPCVVMTCRPCSKPSVPHQACCDPTFLFSVEQYTEAGALFWCDMYAFDEKFVRMYDPWQVRFPPQGPHTSLRPSHLPKAFTPP
jgi:hypothetical protein